MSAVRRGDWTGHELQFMPRLMKRKRDIALEKMRWASINTFARGEAPPLMLQRYSEQLCLIAKQYTPENSEIWQELLAPVSSPRPVSEQRLPL